MGKTRKKKTSRVGDRSGLGGLPLVIAALTAGGLAIAVAAANLSTGSSGSSSFTEIGLAGNEAEGTTLGPDIHFAATGVDFGTVPLNKEVSYAFSFKNIGNDVLRIQDVQVRVVQGC